MTKLIALLGAGFSRNWDGWLAGEVFEYLLGTPEVVADPALRALLWRHREGGFEDALAELQLEHHQSSMRGSPVPLPNRAQLDALESAVGRMFNDMNEALTRKFELDPLNSSDVGALLPRFDAIFTLNQDTLLERLYVRRLSITGSNRFRHAVLPGMCIGERIIPQRGELDFWSDHWWKPMPKADLLQPSDPQLQPIYKLHGSSNWRTADGKPMLIIGGHKTLTIAQHEVLAWYAGEFDRWLAAGARVMVIGYGFRDGHINEALLRAANTSELQLFVIDPAGSEVAKHADSWARPMPGTGAVALFERSLTGASRRSLLATLRSDKAEHMKLERFLSSSA